MDNIERKDNDEEGGVTHDLTAIHNAIEWVQENISKLSNEQLMQELEIIKMWVKNKLQ